MDLRPLYDLTRLIHHDLVTVTLTRPVSLEGGPEESVTVARVRAEPATVETVDEPLGGSLGGTRRTFHFWAAECSGLTPGEDWIIGVEDGTEWVIHGLEVLAHGRRYRVKTMQKQG
jgi:hypothetical protein